MLRLRGTLATLLNLHRAKQAEEHGVRSLFLSTQPNRAQLIEIGKLIDAGVMRPDLRIGTAPSAGPGGFRKLPARGHHRREDQLVSNKGESRDRETTARVCRLLGQTP